MTNDYPSRCTYWNICPAFDRTGEDRNCVGTNGHTCKLATFLDDENNRELIGRTRRPKHTMGSEMPDIKHRGFDYLL